MTELKMKQLPKTSLAVPFRILTSPHSRVSHPLSLEMKIFTELHSTISQHSAMILFIIADSKRKETFFRGSLAYPL